MSEGAPRRPPRLAALSPDRYRRVGELVEQLADVDAGRLPAALAEACGDDEELRHHVAAALGQDGEDDGPGGQAARGALAGAASELLAAEGDAEPSVEIEGYRIVRLLGSGGMGRVYLAEQASPRRLVALKTLRTELDRPGLVRRFEREAEALGRLQHPTIAAVHEAGVYRSEGRVVPYFAMEYIEGAPLLRHARERGLDTAARLELLARICDGVAHAHARGVIHRDLKPANILVDREGQPKILDFGVARVTDPGVERLTEHTSLGEVLGTLPYMSPEQAVGRADAIGPRSDVYSLGVIGYELVSGKRPHELGRASLPQALHAIGHEEPTSLGTLDSRWRGDVDTIITRALAKEPERRYRSAADLGIDLRRHLAHEPIFARPGSWLYRLSRFARRNRMLVAGLAGILLASLAGTAVSTRFALEAREASRLAGRRAEEVGRRHRQALLALAAAALREGDVGSARRRLDATPEPARDWAWARMRGRLDGSLLHVALGEPGETQGVALGADEATALRLSSQGLQVVDLATGQVAARHPLDRPARFLGSWPPWRRLVLLDERGLFLLDVETGRQARLASAPPGLRDGGSSFASPRIWLRSGAEHERVFVMDVEQDETVPLRGGPPLVTPVAAGLGRKGRYPRLNGDATLLAHPSDEPGVAAVLWDAATGEEVQRLAGPEGLVDLLTFAPDGDLVVGVGESGLVVAWDLPSGAERWRARVGAGHLHEAAFPADPGSLLIFDVDGGGASLDLASGKVRWRLPESSRSWRTAPVLDPTGRVLAAPGRHGVITLFDSLDGRQLRRLVGHEAWVPGLAFDAAGSLLVSADREGNLRAWDMGGGGEPERCWHDGYVYGVDVSPDGRRLASAGWDGAVRLWDLASGAAIATLPSAGSEGLFGTVSYSPDGRWLASAHDCVAVLRDAATGEVLERLELDRRPEAYCEIRDLDWVAGSSPLVVTANGAPWTRWAIADGRARRLETPALTATDTAIRPDGRLIAIADLGHLELWAAEPLRRLRELPGHEGFVWKIAFSPDGTRLASAGADRTVRIWNPETGESRVLQGHSDQVHAVAWSPDGRLLATGGADDAILLWDVATWEVLAELREHDDYVYVLAWSPDGRRLVSGSGDGSVRIWETTDLAARVRLARERRRRSAELMPQVEELLASGVSVGEVPERLGTDDPELRQLGLDLAVGAAHGERSPAAGASTHPPGGPRTSGED